MHYCFLIVMRNESTQQSTLYNFTFNISYYTEYTPDIYFHLHYWHLILRYSQSSIITLITCITRFRVRRFRPEELIRV